MNFYNEEVKIKGNIHLINHLHEIGIGSIKEEILNGLLSEQKHISPMFFYDDKGSELFEEITKLDEYYLTNTEKKILSTILDELEIDFSELNIIEFGSGDSSKISLFLNQIPEHYLFKIKYLPVDISQAAIEKSANELIRNFPALQINGIVADFFRQLKVIPNACNRLFCFFGSTLGNFKPEQVKDFMLLLGNEMQTGDSFLLGLDMVKDLNIIEMAYNDQQGITADFNKNILNVVNNLIGSDFNSNNFKHIAFYNQEKSRIEMHLEALKDQSIYLGSETIYMNAGERIHTENSYKFNLKTIQQIGKWAELNVENIITDDNKWFSLVHYKKS